MTSKEFPPELPKADARKVERGSATIIFRGDNLGEVNHFIEQSLGIYDQDEALGLFNIVNKTHPDHNDSPDSK